MRTLALLPFLLSAILAPAAPLETVPAVLRKNEITRVDPAAREITVGVDPADAKTYRCTAETEIRVDDKPAAFTDLSPGMMVIVTATSPGIAAKLAAMKPAQPRGSAMKQPILQRRVTVPATATARNPLQVGGLRVGELVTIVANKVQWSSARSKSREFCSWNGYPGDRVHGLPRMTLVAIVGRSVYVPAGDTFTFTVIADGGFVLFANDDSPDGNLGSAEVTISVGWK